MAWGSLSPDFSWVDETDPAAVQAAAEAAALRQRRSVVGARPMGAMSPDPTRARPEGATTKVLDHLGESIYNTGAKPARIWGALQEVPMGQPLSERPDIVDAVAQTATDLIGVPALMPGGIVNNAAGIFGGRLAQTADHAKLARAESMAAQGATPSMIHDATGWFQGVDGKWRFEIPDQAAAFRRVEGKHTIDNWPVDRPGQTSIGEAFNHPELMAAYPDLKNLPLKFEDAGQFGTLAPLGSYRPADPLLKALDAPEGITVAARPDRYGINQKDARSITLHELQHAVQHREGFATGGNPANFGQQDEAKLARDALSFRRELEKQPKGMDRHAKENAVIKEYQELGAMDWLPSREARDLAHDIHNNPNDQLAELVRLYGLDQKTTPSSPMDLYRRQAGEVEARNVQKRADWDAQKRADVPPAYSQDVPNADQIVRFGSLSPQASVPMDEASRMQRAVDQGFNVDAFHSTDATFDAFKRKRSDVGIHFGTPGQANDRFDYLRDRGAREFDGAQIIPAKLKLNNPLRVRDSGAFDHHNLPGSLVAAGIPKSDVDAAMRSSRSPAGQVAAMRDLVERHGYDGLVYRNTGEVEGAAQYQKAQDAAYEKLKESQRARGKSINGFDVTDQATPEYKAYNQAYEAQRAFRETNGVDSHVVFRPNQIRSRFAAFDPANKDSGFLLGANAGDKRAAGAVAAADLARDPAFGTLAPKSGNEGLSYLLGDKSKVGVIGDEVGSIAPNGISALRVKGTPDGYEAHRLIHSEGGKIVGAMQVTKTPGGPYTVANTFVDPEHRRRGVATQLNAKAKEMFGDVARSDGPSEAGQAFRDTLFSNAGGKPVAGVAAFGNLSPKAAPPVDEFMKRWDARGVRNYVSNQSEKTGGHLKLHDLVVPKDQRGGGTGSEFMTDLTRMADEAGKTVVLTAAKDYGATSLPRLKEFYKRHGFVENKGRNKDFRISDNMYRRPRGGDQ